MKRQLNTQNMTEADCRAIPADQWAMFEAAALSDENRTKLKQLDVALDTAPSLRAVERLCNDMQALYVQEKMLPNIQYEGQIAKDLLQAHLAFGGGDGMKWCKSLFQISSIMEGESHEYTQQLKAWTRRLPSIEQFMAFLNK